MDTVKDLLELLKTGGPWSLVAIFGWVIRYQYLEKKADMTLHAKEKQDLNDRLIATIEKQTVVLTNATENSRALIAAVSRLVGG